MRERKLIGSFNSVAAGANSNIKVPAGPVYDKLQIFALTGSTQLTEANIKSYFERIELKSGGNILIDATGTDLVDLNKYYGNTTVAGVLPLFFGRPWMRFAPDEDILGFGSMGLENLTLNTKLASGFTSPSLNLYSKEQGLNARRTLPYVEVTTRDYTVGGAGVFEVVDLERADFHMAALHLSGVDITNVEVISNNKVIYDNHIAIAKEDDNNNGKAWQTGYFHINFINNDRLLEALDMNVGKFSLKITTTDAGTLKIIQEKIRGLAQIGRA